MKKNFSLKFMAMAMVAALTVAPGCKDYDDDINNLREQLAQTNKTLGDQVTKLEGQIKDVRAKAEAAQKAADKAWADAQAADAEIKKDLTALAEKLEAEAKKAADKAKELEAKIADVLKRVVALEESRATKAELQAVEAKLTALLNKTKEELKAEIAAVKAELKGDIEALRTQLEEKIKELQKLVETFVGHRISSITLIPGEHASGIAAVWMKTMAYLNEDAFDANHRKYGYVNGLTDVTYRAKLDERDAWYSTSNTSTAYFKVSPETVTASDFTQAYINSWVSKNLLRAEGTPNKPAFNEPIKPVEGQVYKIVNGVLAVDFVKTVKPLIGSTMADLYGQDAEQFYMFNLSLPFAKSLWTEEEKGMNAATPSFQPAVTSEGIRIEEISFYPRIKSLIASQTYAEWAESYNPATGAKDAKVMDYRPYVLDKKGRPTHFSDSVILYTSAVDKLVDVVVDWKKGDNLMKYVEVSLEDLQNGPVASDKYFNALKLNEYKDYNLGFRFYLAKGAYLQGRNKTNQQEFAVVTPDGTVTSRVYDDPNGETKTAVGREPIIRVELYDKGTGVTIDQRYIKIKFAEVTPEFEIPTIVFEDRELSCDSINQRLNTRRMNLEVYRKLEEYGISKAQFHKIYTDHEIEYIKKDGVALKDYVWIKDALYPHENALNFVIWEDPNDNTSYNFTWGMGIQLIGEINKATRKSTFELKVRFKSSEPGRGDLLIPFTYSISLPTQKFVFNADDWSAGKAGQEFKVNPIVYRSQINGNDGTGEGRSHISANLVNGYVFDKNNQKPTNVNQLIRNIEKCAKVKFVFDAKRLANYEHLKGYQVSKDGESLWNTTPGTPRVSPLDGMDAPSYHNEPGLAASIHNRFGVTAISNNSETASYDYTEAEVIGRNEDRADALIALHELDDQNATPAALPLVGKKVPVNLEVQYNKYNTVVEHQIEVFFINPLELKVAGIEDFTDAETDGDFISVKHLYKYQDWNKKHVEKNGSYPAGALYNYYAVQDAVFDIANVKTNFKRNGDVFEPTEGVTDGPFPAHYKLEVGEWVASTKTWTKNPAHIGNFLAWFNNKGTPVNIGFKLFFTAEARYKWGVIKFNLSNNVRPAQGTNP